MSAITKKALISSFFKLLKNRPYKKITVSDITSDCGVNRMTFYYHFKDINDLVEKAFEDVFNQTLKNSKIDDDWSVTYLNLFNIIFAKKEFVKKLYPEFDIRDLIAFIFPLADKMASEAVEQHIGNKFSENTKKRVVHAIGCCIVGSFLEWLESDMAKAPQDIVNDQKELFDAAIIGILASKEHSKK